MTITTKLDVGQQANFMLNNKAVSRKIRSIKVNVSELGHVGITYRCQPISGDQPTCHEVYEPDAFATKKDLLASL